LKQSARVLTNKRQFRFKAGSAPDILSRILGWVVGQSCNKRFSLSAIAAAGGAIFLAQLGSGASAAGPAYSWTRCFVGAQAGVATSASRWTYTDTNLYSSADNINIQVPGAHFNDNRGIIGLQAGCDRAIADSWLIGIEGSWFSNPMNSRNNNSGFTPFPPNFNLNQAITTNIQSVIGITPRLGLAVTPDWLLYAKGGYAAAKINTFGTFTPNDFDNATIGDFNTTGWHSGWAAGAGVEYRLFRNVTVGMEYDYYGFESALHSGITGLPGNTIDHRVNANVQTLMGRLNFALDTGPSADDTGPYAAYAAYVKAPPLAQPVASFSAFTTSEVKVSSWDGTRGANVFAPDHGSGYQVYSPTTIGIDYNVPSEYKLETRLKGGYVYAAQNTAGQIARYEGPVDTQASFNLTLLNFDSIRPLLGLSLNLPTGNSYLPGNERFTRMDPDLVEAGSYGVGFNINPTAGFIVGLNQTTAVSLSVGWTWQGPFTKEGITSFVLPNPGVPPPPTVVYSAFDLQQKVSPGNAFTANGNISSALGNLFLMASFAYMGDSHASIDGVATGKGGAKLIANGAANWQIDERWALSTNVSWTFSEKNEIADGFGGLVVEPKNSNSNLVIGSVEPSYMVTETLRVAANYSFLWRDRNYYDPLEDQFIPAKQKHQLGASATYALSQTTSVTLRGSHAWVRQDDGPLLLTETATLASPAIFALSPPMLTYGVWAASIAATVNF
jgi:outer membrane immunogenic protein